MKVTECLDSEHRVFLLQLGVLERMLAENAADGELRAVVLALAEAVEKHREVEEGLLYPAIRRAFGETFPPVAVMEHEHRQIEQTIGALRSHSGSVPEAVRRLVEILRAHIQKETEVLFPMAEKKIPAEELEHLAHRCASEHHACGEVSAHRGN
ncbi:MAG: hypothetical protein KatS3mg076_2566 [Candidatus Binatia bacterium]|nr:MAG: hypothetical protein KatS3mg076_2566 [Candidatus Binatia bacterium]